MSNLVKNKDSRWLQIDICQEYLTKNCPRNELCKYAHPPENVEIENGKVIACYDSFKGRCSREGQLGLCCLKIDAVFGP